MALLPLALAMALMLMAGCVQSGERSETPREADRIVGGTDGLPRPTAGPDGEAVRALVRKHAQAWETGNETLLDEVLHEKAVFAYPRRRLNKTQALEDLRGFAQDFNDTRVHINRVVVEGEWAAVEWKFASTNKKTGVRTAVSDAIIAQVKDGKFISWKEYLDGRVGPLQANGTLALEEEAEPYPWPRAR